MKITRIMLTALYAAALAAAVSCEPDETGEGLPPIDVRIWVADQPEKSVLIYDQSGSLWKLVGDQSLFSKPNDIDIADADGAAWVCDFYTNRVRKFAADGNLVYSTPGGEGEPLVRNATGVSVSQSTGDCWVADRGHNRILRLGAGGSVLATVTGFAFPRAVAADAVSGDVWVADENNDAVVKVDGTASGDVDVHAVELGRYTDLARPWAVAAAEAGRAWAASRSEGEVVRVSAGAEHLASVRGFGTPAAIAFDGGALYVADGARGTLVALPADLAGDYADYASVALFIIANLDDPEDVFVDAGTGRIFVAETGAGRVRVYDHDGAEVSSFKTLSSPAAVAAWATE